MSDSEEKAKKLKEIQDRLSEIQKNSGKSAVNVVKPEVPVSKSEIPEKKKTQEPLRSVKSASEKEKVSESSFNKPQKTMSQAETLWKENRFKSDSTKSTPSPKKSSKKINATKLYTIFSLMITVAVASYFIYTFFLKPVPLESVIPHNERENEMLSESEATNNSNETTMPVNDEKTDEQEAVLENQEVIDQPAKEKKVNPKPVPSAREKIQKPEPEKTVVASAPSGIIISYVSNSTREMAAKNVQMLLNKGFKASYYYMPDKNPSSPKLYKVFVGPYSNESEAMPDFRKIVDLNDKAFILRLN